MARSKTGIGPTNGRLGGWSFFIRQGEVIARIGTNRVSKKAPTRNRARQQSRFANLLVAWRSFSKELKGCFENKKPGANDYSGFMAANLPEARVFLTKRASGRGVCVADNFYVAMGSLQPSIQVEESGEWMLSDIAVGDKPFDLEADASSLANAIVSHSNGAFRMGDELLFVRMNQRGGWNHDDEAVHSFVYRLTLKQDYRKSLGLLFHEMGLNDGFQVVDGRLAARRKDYSLVAWIRLRHENEGVTRVTTQRLVGHNPMLPKFISEEAMLAAIESYQPRGNQFMTSEQEEVPQISISTSSNDVALGTVEGGGLFAPGAVVTLRAVAAAGARFVIWDDGCATPERTLAAMADASFKAIFVPKEQV